MSTDKIHLPASPSTSPYTCRSIVNLSENDPKSVGLNVGALVGVGEGFVADSDGRKRK